MAETENVKSEETVVVQPPRLMGVAAVKAHVTLVLGLTFCAVAFWFEIGRAEGGNSLSWAYVFEWPLLAMFAVYMWWKIVHPGQESPPTRKSKKPAIAPEYEGMLVAWQEHQRELAKSQGLPPVTEVTDGNGGPL